MSTTYTPDAGNNPATITLPSDLDAKTAESVNAAFRALADRGAFLNAATAKLAGGNTFTANQTVVPPSESDTVLYCSRVPGTTPSGNNWTPVFRFNIESDYSLRFYVGSENGVGRWAWVINAIWNVDDQMWELEKDSATAAALVWRSADFSVYYVDAEADPFASWASLPSVGSTAAVRALGEFKYVQPKARTRTVPVSSASGGLMFFDGDDGSVSPATIDDHSYIRFPLRVAPGDTLTKVNVLHHISVSATETFAVTRRRPTWDVGDPVVPSEDVLASVVSDSGTGDHITSITVSATVDKYDELCLRWTPSALLANNLHAINIEFADVGPSKI
jgi:hypothetical protein